MREAAKKFEFEKAARLRDTIKELRAKEFLFRRAADRFCDFEHSFFDFLPVFAGNL
jgi:hypothetical protein